jgi:hypothetical protein
MRINKNRVRDLREYRESRALTLDRSPRLGRMHGEQFVSADVLPFRSQRRNQRRPRCMRDSLALKPLLGSGFGNADVVGHLRDGRPAAEHFRDAFHNKAHYDGDGLSRQAVATIPVLDSGHHSTIRRMGRARTPIQFNKELALRLKSARIAAGYDTQPPFAKALGIEVERYKKWESGRTPFQHEFLPEICRLTGKDANFFYAVEAIALPARRAG